MSSIKKIVLEVGGVELSLSPEDAKALQMALNELFLVRGSFPTIGRVIERQYVPIPTYPPRRWDYWYMTTTDGTVSGNLKLLNSTLSRTDG